MVMNNCQVPPQMINDASTMDGMFLVSGKEK